MKQILLAVLLCVFGIFSVANFSIAEETAWSTSLVFDGGGDWTYRIPVSIENRTETPLLGKPISVPFNNIVNNIDFKNINLNIEEIRVTSEKGQELLFAVYSASGKQLLTGSFPQDGNLTIPVECEAGKTATFFVYFGNEKAKIVPDYLETKPDFFNGDFEYGNDNMPDGWNADPNDNTRQHFWISDESEKKSAEKIGEPSNQNFGNVSDSKTLVKPHSGTKMLKTVIKSGAEPSWFAVRQSGFPVIGGTKYRFSAWVRGENVAGKAGWFLHVGNEKNAQIINSVRDAGNGTFDWREITFEFTAPPEAVSATIGTVLYGTGTAWFDDVSFEKLTTDIVPNIHIGKIQNSPYKIISADSVDTEIVSKIDNNYICRSIFRIINTSDKPMNNVPVLMTLRGTLAHGLLGTLTDLFLDDTGNRIPVTLLDAENQQISAQITVPAKTVKYFNVYYRFDETKIPHGLNFQQNALGKTTDTAHPELQLTIDPFADLPNLVKNGNFEKESPNDYPPDWLRNENNPPEGVRYSLETSPDLVRFGKRCARLDVDDNVPVRWRGWTQRISIEPNHTYLVQGWLRTKNTTARIHLHFHTADGALTQNGSMTSLNQDVSEITNWTRVAEVFQSPPDARFMTIHLTTNSTGTLWHDNISVFDGLFAQQIERESFCSLPDEKPLVWQVPAIVKVFPQTILSPTASEPEFLHVEAARNEKEPIQLALRSRTAKTLQIRVTPPRSIFRNELKAPRVDFVLNRFEINVVGYVPVDYPTNYYITKIEKWYRKTPTSAPDCDGWSGLWSDPLLPTDTLTLQPNQTQAAWITWSIPKNAPPGDYLGKVELLDTGDGKIVYEKQIKFTVRKFTLPDENHISALYGPNSSKFLGKPLEDFNREIREQMTDNRLVPDTINISPKVELKNGKFLFDWTEFDKAATWYINEQKVRLLYAPMVLYIFGWGHPPKQFFGEQPYSGEFPFKDADFSQLRPEYKERYQSYLREFWNHIQEKGWSERFVLFVSDEPNFWTQNIIVQMKAVCEMIHEVDPKIPIYSSTWRYVPEWSDSLDIWGIGHYGIVPIEKMNEIKQQGSKIWFTTDGMLCLDTPYCAIERLLPYYCFKYGADAYEFWRIAWLTYNPYQYGSHAYIYQSSTPGEYYWVRYPNGDGYMIYPGQPIGSDKIVTSIRFAQAREGIEDSEYFYMLEQLIEKAKKSGKDVSKIEAILESAKSMVDCPSPIGRFSSKILPNPHKIYEIRRQVADAIETF
ncbi:MAG: DUF4091 domain-containing protein [Planctomycetaceae bacterium]|jgi:hypothetical protein|nr:DUF4091 domain-containing protein [Planctomycetaceae bacterium]